MSSASTLSAINALPKGMIQVPGTKPWLLGVGRMGAAPVPFINIGRLLAIPRSKDESKLSSETALYLRGESSVGPIAIVVDEVISFFEAGVLEDCDDSDFKIPPGLGSCLRGTVNVDHVALKNLGKPLPTYEGTWALIDLKALISDPKIQNIDLN